MTEFVVDHEQYMNPVPPDVREVAVLVEPFTIAEKAMAQVFWLMQHRPPWFDPEIPGDERGYGLNTLVLSVGHLGLLGAMILVLTGIKSVISFGEAHM